MSETGNETDAADRFPRENVEFEAGCRVWVSCTEWYRPDEIGHTRDCRKGVEVVEDRPEAGEILVEFREDRRVVDRRSARGTDLEVGEDVVIEYESVYSDNRIEKTGTIGKVLRSRGELGGSFEGLYVDLDDETRYYVNNTGTVKTKDPRRRIGHDAVVERVDSGEDDDSELAADGGVDEATDTEVREAIDDVETELVTDGGRELEADHGDGFDAEYVDKETAERCIRALTADLKYDNLAAAELDSLDLLDAITPDDADETEDDDPEIETDGGRDEWEPDPAELRDGETTDEAHARRHAAALASLKDEDDDGPEIVTDGGFPADDPRAEWCERCQRYRIECSHTHEVATDGGTTNMSGDSLIIMDGHNDRAEELSEDTSLTAGEANVAALKEDGLSHAEIAEELGLSKSTVDEYSLRIKRRFREARGTVDELGDLLEDVDRGDGVATDGGEDLDDHPDRRLDDTTAYCGEPTIAEGELIECEKAPGHDGSHAGHISDEDTSGLLWDLHEWGDESNVATDGGEPTGTAILADERGRSLEWHHSVEFDGFVHKTSCDRVIDTDDVRDALVELPEAWNREVARTDGCSTCSRSISNLEDDVATDGGEYREIYRTDYLIVSSHDEESVAIRAGREPEKARGTIVDARELVDAIVAYLSDVEDDEDVETDGGRDQCTECGAYLPDEIEPGTGVYCPSCGTGQHVSGGGGA